VVVTEPTVQLGVSRRERLRAMMRDDILSAAREIVREEGFRELSMRSLARAVGVTAPTLYDYFANKEAVLDALYVAGINGMIDDYDRILAEEESGLTAIVQMARRYREIALTQQDIFLLIFGRVDSTYQPGEEECAECHGLFQRVIAAMRRAIEQGAVIPCDPEAAAYFLWTTVHGAVMLEVNQIVGKWDVETLRMMFEQNLRMIRLAFEPKAV
jgi:AcrR family transcriptional regulator